MKRSQVMPVDGDVFIFKGESGELQAAEVVTKRTHVYEDAFHRCDYLLPDGTRCEFR